MTDLALFEMPAPPPRCRTCGTACEWVEPVSGECHACNHKTVGEVLTAYRVGDSRTGITAYRRHLSDPKWMPRKPRRMR